MRNQFWVFLLFIITSVTACKKTRDANVDVPMADATSSVEESATSVEESATSVEESATSVEESEIYYKNICVNEIDHDCETWPQSNCLVSAEFLLKMKASGELLKEKGGFDIKMLRQAKDAEAVKVLIAEGADFHETDEDLIISCYNDPEMLKLAIQAGADVNESDFEGITPLMFIENPEAIRVLIDAGADVNRLGMRNETAMQFHCDNDVVRQMLIDAGSYETEIVINEGCVPNYPSILSGNRVCKQNNTTKPLARDTQIVNTNMSEEEFVEIDDVLTMQQMIKAGVRKELLNARLLSWNDDICMVEVLLDAGADVHLRDKEGRSPLMNSCSKAVAAALIAAGADVNARDNDGKSVLMLKAECFADILIAHGADVNARDSENRTPLMYCDRPDTVRALIAAGADVNARDSSGQSIEDYYKGALMFPYLKYCYVDENVQLILEARRKQAGVL